MNSQGFRLCFGNHYDIGIAFRRNSCTKCQYRSGLPETRAKHSFQSGEEPCCLDTSTSRSRKYSADKDIEKNNVNSNATINAVLCSILPVTLLSAPASVALVDENGHYSPSPMESPSPEIWFGFIVGVIPFIIASYEFGKRILIQRRCESCGGRGLVKKGKYWKKCTKCGGMLPWLGWKAFWFSTFTDPGNGGPLLQPHGQGSRILYKVPKVSAKGENNDTRFDDLDNQQETTTTGIRTNTDDDAVEF
eukprot:jgi/Picsp_1/3277/NSC_06117-R1_hypothetical protein COCSUDRAFT_54440 [Coccomyxa subellipsoidea C-169]